MNPVPDTLEAAFTATRTDMAAFQRHVTAGIRRSVRTPLYWLVLVVGAFLAGTALSGGLGVTVDLWSAAVVAGLVPAIWWPLSRLYRLAAAPGDHGSLVGPRVVRLDRDGVTQEAPLHRGFTAWAGILAVHRTATHVFLMTDTLAGYVVPRRAFPDEASWMGFAAEADARMCAARPDARSRP